MSDHDYLRVLAGAWSWSFCDAVLQEGSDEECVEIVSMMSLDMRGLSPAEIVEGCGSVDMSDIAEHEKMLAEAIRDNQDSDTAAVAISRLRSLIENRGMTDDTKIKPGKGKTGGGKRLGKPRV